MLIVEDNRDAAATLARLIEMCGHEPRVAHDAASGFAAAVELSPDLALLDIGLPDMSGEDLARRLRGHGCCRTSLIVAVSGYDSAEDRAQSRLAGFDAHVKKPADRALIESILAQFE